MMKKTNQSRVWKALAVAFLYLLLFVGIQAVVSWGVSLVTLFQLVQTEGSGLFRDQAHFAEIYTEMMTQRITAITLVSNALSILIAWLIFTCRKQKFTREIGLVKTKGINLISAVLFGVGLSFTVDFVIQLLPIPESVMESFTDSHNMLWEGKPIINFLSVALLAPAAEEVFFRGMIYNGLKKAMRPLIAGAVSAAVFGMVHGAAVWMLVGFLAGVGLAWIYETTGSLWTSVLVHVTNNTIAQITAYWSPQSAAASYGLEAAAAVLLVLSVWLLHRNNPRPSGAQEAQ